MGFKVVLSPQALERLEAIVRYIAREDPLAAERAGTRLLDHAELLAQFPELGAPYPRRAGVRRLLCRPYFIYYRIDRDSRTIQVLELWHCARQEPEDL